MKLCRDCFSSYKRSRQAKKNRKAGILWGKGNWPSYLYHNGTGRYCERHIVYRRFYAYQRHTAKLKAFPKWANKEAILEVYKKAKRIEKETGIKQHVDHIVPLRGKNVCGLHVEYNLQVLSARENIAKNNKWPYKGYE
jgi:hypothetical protein